MQPIATETACLGKLPTHGDFVRHRASTPTMRSFDEWVRTGLRRIRQRHGRGWDAHGARKNAPMIRFLFSGRDHEASDALLGVLALSRDRSGRTFPFTVACELPPSALQGDPLAHLPLQAAPFFTAAEPIVQDATAGALSYQDLGERLDQIPSSFSLEASAPAEYTRFKREWTMNSLLERLFGDFEDGRKYQLLKNLLDIFLPQRDYTAPRLNYGIQFPLGTDEDLYSKIACFWLDTSLRLLDHPDAPFSFFWTPQPPTSVSPFFLLFVGSPRAHVIFHLLAAKGESDDLFRVETTGAENGTREASSLPDTYRSLVEDPALPLQDFLQQL